MSYYLTKSNPNIYRLRDALNYYQNESDISWTTVKHAKHGGILFLGQSGEEAGIYARTIIIDTPTFEEPDDPRFFVNPEDARKLAWLAPLESPLDVLEHPVLEPNLKKIPVLERVVKWLHRQGKACYLTDEEGVAIDRLINR